MRALRGGLTRPSSNRLSDDVSWAGASLCQASGDAADFLERPADEAWRIVSEVLCINIYSHRAMEQVLRGFNTAYNARRQRVLDGRMTSPHRVIRVKS